MSEVAIGLLVVAGLLTLVSILQPLTERLRIPQTVMLALVGIAAGCLLLLPYSPTGGGLWDDTVSALTDLELPAEVLLTIFLPVLLFHAGLTIDVRRMLDDVAPILSMAVVAVAVCTAFVGFAVGFVSTIPLAACLLLGAIVATTDPIAVVGVFRDIGAPRRLTILVEGESLLNDATAIALMTVLLDFLVRSATTEPPDVLLLFASDFFGGAALGAVGAWIAVALLKLIRQRPLAEVTVSIALPYILYILAEDYINTSGVMAVVIAALVIGARGRTNVTPQTWSIMMTVWDQIVFLASALVFIMVAMKVPQILLQVYWSDLLVLAIMIVAAFAARAVSLFGLMPMLRRLGLAERVSNKFKLVMLWGGLRGAVTLVLALAIIENNAVSDEISRFIGVLAMAFVLFTLLVNGTTLRPIMHVLKLDRLSNIDRALRDRTLGLALSEVADRIMDVSERYRMGGPATDALVESYRQRRTAAIQRRENLILDPEEEYRLGLIILATREEELYLHHFGQDTVSRHTAVELVAKAGRMRDAAKTQGRDGYLKAAEGSRRSRILFQLAMWLQARLRIGHFLERRLADRFENTTITRIVLSRQLEFTDGKLLPLMGRAVCLRLKDVLVERLHTVNNALDALRRQFPDYAERLQTRFLRQAALRLEEREYDALAEEGVLNSEIMVNLKRRIGQRWATVAKRPSLDLGLDTETLVRGFPLFEGLPDSQIRHIRSLMSPRLAVPGERLMSKGERGDFMLFISSGAIEVHTEEARFSLGRGDFVGEMAILDGKRRRANVTAVTYCQLLVLPGRDFRRFAKANPNVRQLIKDTADERAARLDEADPALVERAQVEAG